MCIRDRATGVGYDELATVNGKMAQVVKIAGDDVTLKVFEGTEGIPTNAEVLFLGKAPTIKVRQSIQWEVNTMAIEKSLVSGSMTMLILKLLSEKFIAAPSETTSPGTRIITGRFVCVMPHSSIARYSSFVAGVR